MIVVRYQEKAFDHSNSQIQYIPLGTESHDNIDEVLLPKHPDGSPIFFTKKFRGRPEHRWQVEEVSLFCLESDEAPIIYKVTLSRRPQINKQYYLKNIVAGKRGTVRSVLHPWAIVEVEFGHSMTVGKISGDIRDSKRYVDTIQLHNMPKRRLAIVNQIIPRRTEDLVQVIPISSKAPLPNEEASIEVTTELAAMVNYRERSWAIGRMIQTVTASRVIAPSVYASRHLVTRDKGFRNVVREPVRSRLKDALMHGVAAAGRLTDATNLSIEKSLSASLTSDVDRLTLEQSDLQAKIAMYEQFVIDSGMTFDDVEEMYRNA